MEMNKAITGIEKCFTTMNSAIEAFQNFLSARTSGDTTSYYQAQKYFDEGNAQFKDSLSEISEIIGFVPADASPAFRQWKESYLEKVGILSQNTEFEALRSELQNDEFLLKFLTPEEIDILHVRHFESQQTGKRKLSHIKARILFDKIQSLMSEAENLAETSKERLYQQR